MMLWGLVWLEYEEAQMQCAAIRRASSHSSTSVAGQGTGDARALQLDTWPLNGFQSRLVHRLQKRLCREETCAYSL